MSFIKFIIHLLKRSYLKMNLYQRLLVTILIMSNLLIGLISFIKIVLPFTYVAI
jgi:hypothetical protein